jgi:hypothetical protein
VSAMPRAVAVLALAALLACDDEPDPERCAGDLVAKLAFEGGGEVPVPPLLPGEPELPVCPDVPAEVAFTATIAFTGEDTAALCTNRRFAAVATGPRAGDAIDVSTITSRAILTQCGEGCLVEVRERLAGTLLPSAAAPERFEGALVDTVLPAASASLCGDCALPCAARYGIRGVAPEESLSSPADSRDSTF